MKHRRGTRQGFTHIRYLNFRCPRMRHAVALAKDRRRAALDSVRDELMPISLLTRDRHEQHARRDPPRIVGNAADFAFDRTVNTGLRQRFDQSLEFHSALTIDTGRSDMSSRSGRIFKYFAVCSAIVLKIGAAVVPP